MGPRQTTGGAATASGTPAAEVLDYRDQSRWTKAAEVTPSGVDVFLECSTHYDFAQTLPLLAHGGRFVIIAGLGATPALPVGELYVRDASLRGFVISNASVTDLEAAAGAVNRGLATGVLTPRIGARLSLADAAEAHRLQESGKVRGRIVLIP